MLSALLCSRTSPMLTLLCQLDGVGDGVAGRQAGSTTDRNAAATTNSSVHDPNVSTVEKGKAEINSGLGELQSAKR